MSSSSRRPECVQLGVPGAERAVLDLPTGRIILVRGHNDIVGTMDDLRALAHAILAACDRAERGDYPRP
ncbi:hypothetical protein J2X65_001637 [Ancylobacter sp. 3268]|uniref:hypothetical protein n=1 Tax=Ancylobacter sp. 3268 TaxID=2817752 RepID=UPI00285D54DB|nr:hypothetical protein [Ancylobacter sp. 3268]MDR6952282.1 hypothetical protein [Ancylobacter sp. 3268]